MKNLEVFSVLYCSWALVACHAPQKDMNQEKSTTVVINDLIQNCIPEIPALDLQSGFYSKQKLGNYSVSGEVDAHNLKQGLWEIYNLSDGYLFSGHFLNGEKNGWWHITIGTEIVACGNYGFDKKQGFWRVFPLLKKTKLFVYLENDTLVDLSQEFSKDSILLSEGKYFKGLKDNYWKFYSVNGSLKEQGYFYSGLKNGWWQKFNENGKLVEEASYSMNEIAGYVKRYNNGILIEEGKQINDKRKRTWKFYNDSGQMKQVKEYEN